MITQESTQTNNTLSPQSLKLQVLPFVWTKVVVFLDLFAWHHVEDGNLYSLKRRLEETMLIRITSISRPVGYYIRCKDPSIELYITRHFDRYIALIMGINFQVFLKLGSLDAWKMALMP